MDLCNIIAIVLLSVVPWTACMQDLTMKPGATGCEVTKAAVDKCETSQIFRHPHNFLMYRIAFTSDFGKRIFVPGAVGIWQFTNGMLDQAKKKMKDLKIEQLIRDKICIDFAKATMEDMKKPIFNAVGGFIHLAASKGVPKRMDINGQLNFWIGISGDNGEMKKLFPGKAGELDKNKGIGGSGCLVCTEQPSDVIFIIDDSGSIGSKDWTMQIKFVQTVLDHLKPSMDRKATQVALISFGSGIGLNTRYSFNRGENGNHLNNYKRMHTWTNIPLSIRTAIERIEKVNEGSRKNDKAIRKLLFFVTDGENSREEENFVRDCKALKKQPVASYAIGASDNVKLGQLQQVASRPEYVRVYKNFNEFNADIAAIIYETCRIGAVVNTKIKGPAAAKADSQGTVKLDMRKLSAGETRYFKVTFVKGSIMNLVVTTKKLTLNVYASFNQQYPSEANYDFKRIVKPGDNNALVIKDPHKFLNDICKQDNKGHGDSFNVAINAVGPPGTTEDVVGVITIKKDEPSKWEDYTADEEVFAENVQMSYNHTVRLAWSERVTAGLIVKYSSVLMYLSWM